MAYQLTTKTPLIGFNAAYGIGEPATSAKQKTSSRPFQFVCNLATCGFPFACTPAEFAKRVVGAIKLARNAAGKLNTPDQKTKDTFLKVFGHPVTQDWEKPGCPREKVKAGLLVQSRFTAVQMALQKRKTLYRCLSDKECGIERGKVREGNPRHPSDLAIDDTVALAVLCKDEVLLCPSFWSLTDDQQEGTILHEMFHLRFGLTCAWFQHDQNERPRNSAYCYEIFALLLAGKIPTKRSIDECAAARNKPGKP